MRSTPLASFATRSPARRRVHARWAVSVILAAVGLAFSTGTATAAKPTPKPVVLTAPQITTGLLTLSDLPTGAGYQGIGPAPGGDSPPPRTPSQTRGACNGPDVLAQAQSAGNVAMGVVSFSNDNTDGPYVDEVVFSFPSNAAAKRFMTL